MTLLPVHIAAGSTALVSGFIALYARKGARLHCQSGMVFFYATLIMAGSAALLATITKPNGANVLQSAFAFYLVTTAVLAVRRPAAGFERIEIAAMLLVLAVGFAHITFGWEALHNASGTKYGYPPALYFTFGPLALVAGFGDMRMLLRGLQGKSRIARHLWRMCLAMFIASGSFFFGQAKVLPKAIRIPPLLAIPALLPLVVMLYWLASVWFTKASVPIGSADRSRSSRMNAPPIAHRAAQVRDAR
jgi:uncharacterized membrane protein